MWAAALDLDSALTNFQDELIKDGAVLGSWDRNYLLTCEKFKCVPCPFFVLTSSIIKVSNCIVDLTSWRCMLLALSISTPTITDISVHNCQLRAQHVLDLTATLIQIESGPKNLRLEYLQFGCEEEKLECFRTIDHLFTSDVKLEYLSLRGNYLGDEMIIRNTVSLQTNFYLKTLNLTSNGISDNGASILLRILRINITLKEISLSNNNISGESSSETTFNLLVGTPYTADDETTVKTMTKLIAEYNKKQKELNKKKKKSGTLEAPEIAAPKKDQAKLVNGQMILCNRNFSVIDFSMNPILERNILPFLDQMKNKAGAAALVAAFGPCSSTLLLKQIVTTGVASFHIPLSTIADMGEIGIFVVT